MIPSLDYHRLIEGAREMVVHTKSLRALSEALIAESKITLALSRVMCARRGIGALAKISYCQTEQGGASLAS